MARFELTPRSGLERFAAPGRYGSLEGEPGVTLTLRENIALASVMGRKDTHEALARRVRDTFAIELPLTPRYVMGEQAAFIWAGAGQWLALAEDEAGHAFTERVRTALAGLASIIDQSDGRTIVRVSGSRARDALAKGMLIDLHPRAFGPGHVAVTGIAHVGVHCWQVDAAPTYEFAVFRSFAAEFSHWLMDSAAEFGVAVESQ